LTFPAVACSLMVLVLTAGVVSAAAVGNRRASTGEALRAGDGGLAADGTVRAAGGRLSGVSAEAPTTPPGRPGGPAVPAASPERPTSTTTPPATTVTTRRPGSTSSSTTVPPVPSSPAVEIPFSPGRTSWTGVSSGVTITVTVDKAAPAAGEPLHFDVVASSATRSCCDIVLRFGDGTMYPEEREPWSCPSGGPQGHGPVTSSVTHTYGQNNRWTFWAQAITGNCDEASGSGALFGEIQVGPTQTGQGPAVPDVWVARSGFLGDPGQPPPHQGDRTWASVVGTAKDDDGWVRSASIDWGDGTPKQVVQSGMICRPAMTGWPSGTQITFGAVASGEGTHHYAAPGTYTVTVTAVSTGCDGTMTQTGRGSLVWDTA
jgi:hypothetical protein